MSRMSWNDVCIDLNTVRGGVAVWNPFLIHLRTLLTNHAPSQPCLYGFRQPETKDPVGQASSKVNYRRLKLIIDSGGDVT